MRFIFILLMLAGFSLPAQASGIVAWPAKKAAAPAPPPADPAPITDGTQDPFAIIGEIAGKSRFTIFSDSNHMDVETFAFFAREENIAALAAAGKRHIFVEMLNTVSSENDIQNIVDAYARDPEKTPEKREEFINQIAVIFSGNYLAGYNTMALRKKTTEELGLVFGTAFADLVERASAQGMRVYCADNMDFATQSPELRTFLSDLKSDLPPGFELEEAIQSSPALMEEYQQIILASRLNDTGLAGYISRVSGPENAVIYYGILHGNREGDLDELLGKANTRRIELHASQFAYNSHMTSGKACPDAPAAAFLLAENKFIAPRAPSTVYPTCLYGLANSPALQ